MRICVVAAAIYQDGHIWALPAPSRHHDVFAFMWKNGVALKPDGQGFLLSNGQFASRHEAKVVAVSAGQYKDCTGSNLPELYSEDLW